MQFQIAQSAEARSEDRTVAFDVVHLPDGRVVFARTVTPEDPEGIPIVTMAVPVEDDRVAPPSEPDRDEVFAIWQAAMKARIEEAFPIIEVDESDLEVDEEPDDDKTDPETLIAPSAIALLPPIAALPPLPLPILTPPPPRPAQSTSSLWSVSVAAPVSTPRLTPLPFVAPIHDAHVITIPPSEIRTSDPPPPSVRPSSRPSARVEAPAPPFVRLDASSSSLPPFTPRRRIVMNHALIGLAAMFAAVVSSVGTMEIIRFYRGETTAVGAALHHASTPAPIQ